MACEMRPGGMSGGAAAADDDEDLIMITVTHAASRYSLYLSNHSTFRDVKELLAHKTGLQPEEHLLFFDGKEKDNEKHLHTEGIMDKSELLLVEAAASEERKREEVRKHTEMLKVFEAIAGVRAEVDKLAERVSALEVAVDGRTMVNHKEFLMSTELLMRQLLKLDAIEAQGEARLQRKAEVQRVQHFVDTLDALKARNSSTQWEAFDSVMGSYVPISHSPCRNVDPDWD